MSVRLNLQLVVLIILLFFIGTTLLVLIVVHGADNWLDDVLQFFFHFLDFFGLSGLNYKSKLTVNRVIKGSHLAILVKPFNGGLNTVIDCFLLLVIKLGTEFTLSCVADLVLE